MEELGLDPQDVAVTGGGGTIVILLLSILRSAWRRSVQGEVVRRLGDETSPEGKIIKMQTAEIERLAKANAQISDAVAGYQRQLVSLHTEVLTLQRECHELRTEVATMKRGGAPWAAPQFASPAKREPIVRPDELIDAACHAEPLASLANTVPCSWLPAPSGGLQCGRPGEGALGTSGAPGLRG